MLFLYIASPLLALAAFIKYKIQIIKVTVLKVSVTNFKVFQIHTIYDIQNFILQIRLRLRLMVNFIFQLIFIIYMLCWYRRVFNNKK